MVLDAVSNFVRGAADAEVGTDDTTVSVADASIFPDPETDGEFNVVIWDANNFPRPDEDDDVEILRVTERDTEANELTVTRAQEMTSAATHVEGSAIHLSPTAKVFSDIESTFGDFWDAGAQELTADVNNTNTKTEALEAGLVNTDELVSESSNKAGFAPTILADFEENDTLDIFEGDTGSFTIQNVDVISGTQSLKQDSRSGVDIVDTSRKLTRGVKFSMWTMAAGEREGRPCILVGAQDTGVDNCYRFKLDFDSDNIEIILRDGGTATELASQSVTISDNEPYLIEAVYGVDGYLKVVLKDSSLNIIDSATATDDTLDRGFWGIRSGGAGGAGVLVYDQIMAGQL